MATPLLHDQRILIVDDDEDILASIDLALRTEGATTHTVTDGNAAVSLGHMGFDAVVLDMMLPRRSGFLVLEKLKAEEPPPVVVMITANQGRRHMAYAQDLGVDAYLTKPLPLQQLIETLVELLENPSEPRRMVTSEADEDNADSWDEVEDGEDENEDDETS